MTPAPAVVVVLWAVLWLAVQAPPIDRPGPAGLRLSPDELRWLELRGLRFLPNPRT